MTERPPNFDIFDKLQAEKTWESRGGQNRGRFYAIDLNPSVAPEYELRRIQERDARGEKAIRDTFSE